MVGGQKLHPALHLHNPELTTTYPTRDRQEENMGSGDQVLWNLGKIQGNLCRKREKFCSMLRTGSSLETAKAPQETWRIFEPQAKRLPVT